ncbi:FkbM family methyltransferase [Pseudomonadota bacterium]
MKSIAKRWLETFVSHYGYELVKAGDASSGNFQHSMPTCEERLRRARSLGFSPKYVVDGGAYIGHWTTMVASLFPEAEFLVIEPNPHISLELSENLETLECHTIIVEKALAQEPGKLLFNIWGDPGKATSASLQDHVKGKADNATDVDVDSLDNIISQFSMQPDLVKLDLQGAELSALAGAEEALKHAEMFIVEFVVLKPILIELHRVN